MIGQIINSSSRNVVNRFSERFNLPPEYFRDRVYFFEIRNLPDEERESLKNLLESNEIEYTLEKNRDDFLIPMNNPESSSELFIKIFNQSGFSELSKHLIEFSEYNKKAFSFGGLNIPPHRPLMMGIVNVTEDSFFDGGKFSSTENAYKHALNLIEDGADIIDIGGESTRPNAKPVTVSEEIKRTIPVIEKIISEKPDSVISIDTSKSEVAKQALEAGAKIVNDISGGTFDPEILSITAEYKAAFVLMHILGTPQTMQKSPSYKEVVSDIFQYFDNQITKAEQAGINEIAIDPGIGFGKRIVDNYEIIFRLEEFKSFGLPILIGLSNKSFLGKALNLGIDERAVPTVTAEIEAFNRGAKIIRTHNVKNILQAISTINYIKNPDTAVNV